MIFVPSPITITSVTPELGHTGGRTVVEIIGTGFREPPDPPATGRAPKPPRMARVLFGGVPGFDVEVFGPDLIHCRSPIHDPGTVDVTVQHLGEIPAQLVTAEEPFAISAGATLALTVETEAQTLVVAGGDIATPGAATAAELAAILNRFRGARAKVEGTRVRLRTDNRGPTARLQVTGGTGLAAVGWAVATMTGSATLEVIEDEQATAEQAFTFAMPHLGVKVPLQLAIDQLIIELRRQVHPNASFTTHTDFDPETGDMLSTTPDAPLPSIIIASLETMEAPTRRVLGPQEEPGTEADRTIIKAPSDIVDQALAVVVATDDPNELTALYQVLRRFFRKNGKLLVPLAEGAPILMDDETTYREHQLEWRETLPATFGVQSDNSNILTMSGAAIIRGIPVGAIPLKYSGPQPSGAPAGEHENTTAVTWIADSAPVLGVESDE